MRSKEVVQRQIKALKSPYIFWTKRELNALPNILDEEENILAITSGIMKKRTWLAVCTDRRLLFLNHNMFLGAQQIQFPLDRVQSIDYDFIVAVGSIRVNDGVHTIELGLILQTAILPFVKITQNAMHDYRHKIMQSARTPSAPSTHSAVGASVADQIEKLANLKEKGYITDEEFQQQKKKILSA